MTITGTPLNTEEQRVSDLVEALLAEFPPEQVDAVTFLGAQYDKGLAWVHFPKGCGGLGLNAKLQKQINERYEEDLLGERCGTKNRNHEP